MAAFVREQFRLQQPLVWLDQLQALAARELAPSPRKIRTALRITTIVTIAIGLDASCHVDSALGGVIVWLLAGAGPMISYQGPMVENGIIRAQFLRLPSAPL
jgi:hypothetical protein